MHVDVSDSGTGRRHKVLVVDDERQTVSAVKHLLRRRYVVLGATRASEALELLQEHTVSVVLCDQRMPGMTGDQFFEEVRRRHPDMVRVLITAYADLQALIRSVNHGQIFAYVTKPWSPEELERVVDTAVAFRELCDDNRRINRELKDSNERLARVNVELREFTHAVAHDLKEPLRTILAYAQFLSDEGGEALGQELGAYVDGIARCTGHLRQLIDDLLQVSELDHVPLDCRPVDLGRVVRHATGLLAAAIHERNAEVRLIEPLPTVNGDPGRLMLLFQNLLSNGLKFNRDPRPIVEVAPVPAPDGQVAVRVTDNGIGISPEYRDRIFQIFQRLHSKTEYPGTGAGLAIARKIAVTHGGTLEVDSSPGGGSTFRVTLPAP